MWWFLIYINNSKYFGNLTHFQMNYGSFSTFYMRINQVTLTSSYIRFGFCVPNELLFLFHAVLPVTTPTTVDVILCDVTPVL